MLSNRMEHLPDSLIVAVCFKRIVERCQSYFEHCLCNEFTKKMLTRLQYLADAGM